MLTLHHGSIPLWAVVVRLLCTETPPPGSVQQLTPVAGMFLKSLVELVNTADKHQLVYIKTYSINSNSVSLLTRTLA